jgi:hypothetical protein
MALITLSDKITRAYQLIDGFSRHDSVDAEKNAAVVV